MMRGRLQYPILMLAMLTADYARGLVQPSPAVSRSRRTDL